MKRAHLCAFSTYLHMWRQLRRSLVFAAWSHLPTLALQLCVCTGTSGLWIHSAYQDWEIIWVKNNFSEKVHQKLMHLRACGRCIGTRSQSRSLLNWLCLWQKVFLELHPDIEKHTHKHAQVFPHALRQGLFSSLLPLLLCSTKQFFGGDLPLAGRTSPSALHIWAAGSWAAPSGSREGRAMARNHPGSK